MTKRLTIALLALAVFVVLAVLPASAQTNNATIVAKGGVVFIGEQGLNIQLALLDGTATEAAQEIAWFPSTAQTTSVTPEKVITVSANNASFYVNPSDFSSRTGNWYCWSSQMPVALASAGIAFIVHDPLMDVKIWDLDQNKDVTGKNVVQGTRLTFRVETNGYAFTDPLSRPNLLQPIWETAIPGIGLAIPSNGTMYGLDPYRGTALAGLFGFATNRTAEGFVDIKVKTTEGNTLNRLYNGTATSAITQAIPLTGLWVNQQPWYWGNATVRGATPVGNNTNWMWDTAAKLANGMDAYPPGTYTVTAEFALNSMKDNYKNAGADYSTKTISEARTVNLVSDTVKIEANKDSVVRSNPFSVTITGRPNQQYFLWVKGTSTLADNALDTTVPEIAPNQAGVFQDDATIAPVAYAACAAPVIIGDYVPQNLARVMANDVAGAPAGVGTTTIRHYARILTNENGVRTVEFTTSNWTKTQTYNIRVENATLLTGVCSFAGYTREFRTDEVSVKVEKGAVTVTASGDGSYYLGEEVKFSGTNTESKKTYLFIIGPNLHTNGSNIGNTNPRSSNAAAQSITGNAATFQSVTVNSDNTWSYKWGTSTYSLDAGTYTVYAVSQPNNRNDLADVAYGTVSIIIKKPFVSATASQSTVAKGDKVYIRGTAEGKPSQGVAMWVLGKNYNNRWTTAVENDASFEFDQLDEGVTTNLASGQYFIVVQHPMQNDQFDITTRACSLAATDTCVVNLQSINVVSLAANELFKLTGSGNLQGSDAAEALVEGINSANVDDTYTKLQLLVEEPLIRIDAIGDRYVGDKFTITAQTNLAVDDEVLFEVYSSSFKPTQKSQSGEFSGSTGTVKVTKGDTGMNKLSFSVDAATFKPDEYIVVATAVIQGTTGTALFNVIEGVPTTVATPTPTATPTQAATTVVTTPPPTATPTKAPTQPGFGALVALIGLGAVAVLVGRRH